MQITDVIEREVKKRFCVPSRIVIEKIGWDQGPFVAAFASSNLGDVSPNTRGPKCEFSGNNCSKQYTCPGKKEMCFASGPGRNMFESTSIIANKMFKESWVSQVSFLYASLLFLTLCKFSFVCMNVYVCVLNGTTFSLEFFFYYNKVWIFLYRYFIINCYLFVINCYLLLFFFISVVKNFCLKVYAFIILWICIEIS